MGTPLMLGGNALVPPGVEVVTGAWEERGGEPWQVISGVDAMAPFFMTVASDADHWLFIASTGGLTCGRGSVERALFPYGTEDRLTENAGNTGPVTVLRVTGSDGATWLWEPFSGRYEGVYPLRRSVAKNLLGNQLEFREENLALGLEFGYAWTTSARDGFVRRATLRNVGEAGVSVVMLDGLRNLLPAGASPLLQEQMSCLLDAYKKTELDAETGLGFVTLSAIPTDKAEPSEALRANVVWQEGLPAPTILLCEAQLATFRRGGAVRGKTGIRGQRGAYLAVAELSLAAGAAHDWSIVADVDLDHGAVAALRARLRDRAGLRAALDEEVRRGSANLRRLVASADGLQQVADRTTVAHHWANVMFNIMRGGIFVDGYRIGRDDLADFLGVRSRAVRSRHAALLAGLPETIRREGLMAAAEAAGDADLIRLCGEYLPLCFSRRHGDPSRPWNRFSIALRAADGRRLLSYQGNWRDIFQNWEALALSFPDYLPGMIAVFLDAVTADGYNPYRITRDGIEWEVPEPDNPWSGIGYWGDHQVVYLLKLLEWTERFRPGLLAEMLGRKVFVHAEIPYEIRPFAELLRDPRNSIAFNQERHARILGRVAGEGADGRLLHGADGGLVHANLAEKLLVILLAKLANLVPGGGIWMNTQRPEWNDGNNALARWGLSMVTLAYLRRFCVLLEALVGGALEREMEVAREVADLLRRVAEALREAGDPAVAAADPAARFRLMSALGEAGSDYRQGLYRQGLGGEAVAVSGAEVAELCRLALGHLDAALRANRRSDGLHHAYNLLACAGGRAEIRRLPEMLEGQVSALSSGLLSAAEALDVCRALRASALYRADQHTYLLYPDRHLPSFLEKNKVPAAAVAQSALAAALVARGDRRLLVQDDEGIWHFQAGLRNADELARRLDALAADPELGPLVAAERESLLALYEETFDHHAFTGRSGSFFGYEGLGCIYWHMVAKLLLAVQENILWATEKGAPAETVDALTAAYYDIRAGLGFNKPPADYGAFPADPYSHTRGEGGARQPGMTGQVKEEVITRSGELGVRIVDGCLGFSPALLRAGEFMAEASVFRHVDVEGRDAELPLPPGSLAFTVAQVPVVCVRGEGPGVRIHLADGTVRALPGMALDPALSRSVFGRDGRVRRIDVTYPSCLSG